MLSAPDRDDEAGALAALRALRVLDTSAEAEFDALVRVASEVCRVPISLLSLVDAERQWFKANVGLAGVAQTSRDLAFCAHAVLGDGLFEVPDATRDARFADNPLVTGQPDIRFYAGAPITLAGGERVGTLCVIDREPRTLDDTQREVLRQLSIAASRMLEGRAALRDVERARQVLRKNEEFLQRTNEIAGIGGWEFDPRTGEIFWSDEICRIHGVAPGFHPTLEQAISFYAPASRPLIEAAVARAMATGEAYDLVLEIVRADGVRRSVRAVGSAERRDGQVVRMSGAFQDVTERQQMMARLAEQHELMRVTLQSIGDAVITTDDAGTVTWLNPVAERMTGWRVAEALGRPSTQVFHIVHEETRAPAPSPIEACLARREMTGLAEHTVLVSRLGAEFGIEDSASPIRSASGELLGVVLVFHDVSEQRRLTGEMTWRATHDALTGLVNRAEFEARLSRTLRQAQDGRTEHALLFIDLDQFKLVNDACGHAVGDQLLQQVSKLLADATRARDTLARLGGDEFAVILEHCTAEQAQRVAQKICDRLDDFRFVHDDRRFRIGASIGLVPVDRRWSSTAAVQQAADSSCYAAKEEGRNRVHAWFDTDEAMRARHSEMQWTTRIERALDDDGFELFAQRIVGLSDRARGGGVRAEVLLRMRADDGSVVLPGLFLPAAERFHLATRIDRWVLRQSVAWLQSLDRLDDIESLSVNLSGQSVGDRAFHAWASELLKSAGAALCGRLCLEITETAAVTNLADAALFIAHLRAAGVKVSLDDFGAGASSFGYLKTLPVDYLKIDGQFVRDVVADPLDEAAVRCFTDVARVVGVQTVAEFVDQASVLERIADIGVDYAQGFHLHRPEPLAALVEATASTAAR